VKIFVKQQLLTICVGVTACLLAGVTLLGASGLDSGKNEKGSSPGASRKLKVVVLEGTPHNRGLTHGKAMKEEIHEAVRRWKSFLARAFKTDADGFIRRLVQRTDFVAAIKRWTPQLLEEIQGMAEGAGVDFDTMLVLQLPDECFVNGRAVAAEHCSALGFAKGVGHSSCVAQNVDLPSFTDGLQVVLHIKEDSGSQAFILTQAGCIGLAGMNSHGLGICCNAVWQLNSCRDGLPVSCVLRGVLQQRSEADAVAFLHKVKHATGQNYVIGGPVGVYDFECSAGRVERFKPDGRDDLVWHTNHPLVNEDYTPAYRSQRANPADLAKREADTQTRMECLARRLAHGSAAHDLAFVQSVLRARDSEKYPVSRPNTGNGLSFASVIMMLSESPVFYVYPGPPDGTPYEELSFAKRPASR
jgi:hypothetical protein